MIIYCQTDPTMYIHVIILPGVVSQIFFVPRMKGPECNIFFYTGIHEWNLLPNTCSIKCSNNHYQFKRAVKEHLSSQSNLKKLFIFFIQILIAFSCTFYLPFLFVYLLACVFLRTLMDYTQLFGLLLACNFIYFYVHVHLFVFLFILPK